MTEYYANIVWDLLVRYAKANETQRNDFVYFMKATYRPTEYRFMGYLGFGGKIYLDKHKWGIGYYQEDASAHRDNLVININKKLEILKAHHDSEKAVFMLV